MPPQRPLLASPIFTFPATERLMTTSGCAGQSLTNPSASRLATKFGTAFPAKVSSRLSSRLGDNDHEMLRRYDATKKSGKLVQRTQGLPREDPTQAYERPCQTRGLPVHRRPCRSVALPQHRDPAGPAGGPARGVRRPE